MSKPYSYNDQKHECFKHGTLKRGTCIKHEQKCSPSVCHKERLIRQLRIEGKM